MRIVHHRYSDPLDAIWIATAARIGLRVERSGEVYAATEGGSRLLRIGTAATLDPDDCLAQMIFHELCHSLVEGIDAFERPDWGLDNTGSRDVPREQACLRAQAHLADRHGLRDVLAPTTEYRTFYDALDADPLAPRREPTVAAAIAALQRAERPPWAPHLSDALTATAEIARRAAAFAGQGDLWSTARTAPAPHPTGLPPAPLALDDPAGPARRCGGCAWRGAAGLCRQAGDLPVATEWPACARFEPGLDCQECGACCRAAYDSVTVDPDDPVIAHHPSLMIARASYVELRRDGDRCAALTGGRAPHEPFACAIYADRPRPCREFEVGGENCLIARRRVGLSLG